MPTTSRSPKVVFLGAGKLGFLLIQSWIKEKIFKTSEIHIHVKSKKSFQRLKRLFPKATVTCSEKKASIPSALFYVIAVKPSQWSDIKTELQKHSPAKVFIISLMAGIKASQLEKDLQKPVVVAMTNTSIQVNEALTTLYRSPSASTNQLLRAKKLFNPFGQVHILPEEFFAKASALGGSHPAFIIWLIQKLSLIVADELKIKNSQEWVLQIFEGALSLLKKEKKSDLLIKQIATPGGSTQEGLKTLEELAVETSLRKVFERCSNKAEELGKN